MPGVDFAGDAQVNVAGDGRYILTTIEETQGSLLNDADGVPFMRMSGKVWFKCLAE
ncbi:MAG: hypothetical protein R3C44_24925 [Chloroflexota bacterium]